MYRSLMIVQDDRQRPWELRQCRHDTVWNALAGADFILDACGRTRHNGKHSVNPVAGQVGVSDAELPGWTPPYRRWLESNRLRLLPFPSLAYGFPRSRELFAPLARHLTVAVGFGHGRQVFE